MLFITILEVHYLLGLPPEKRVCIPYPGEEMLILSVSGDVVPNKDISGRVVVRSLITRSIYH
jgi:hypothetical protein